MTSTVPHYVAEILEKLGKLEERTEWSKAIVITIFLAIGGGLAWSGLQQFTLGSVSNAVETLAENAKSNEGKLDKVIAALEKQSRELANLSPKNYQVSSYQSQDYSTTITQCGTFSPATKLADRANVYRWSMLTAIDPLDARNIWAGFEKALPGTAIKARLVDGGKACEMEIIAKDPAAIAQQLEQGITGCVSITVAASTTDMQFDERIPRIPGDLSIPNTRPRPVGP